MNKRAWLKRTEVLEHFGISSQKLRKLQSAAQKADLDSQFANMGTEKNPQWRFKSKGIDSWFQEVTQWQVSRSKKAESGKFAGGIPTLEPGRERSTATQRRRPSGARSRTRSAEDDGGKLLTVISPRDSEG